MCFTLAELFGIRPSEATIFLLVFINIWNLFDIWIVTLRPSYSTGFYESSCLNFAIWKLCVSMRKRRHPLLGYY